MKVGKYIAKVKCANLVEAALNGLFSVFPESKMVYDGKWCFFYNKQGRGVFDCNPDFAKAHFKLKLLTTPEGGKTKEGE